MAGTGETRAYEAVLPSVLIVEEEADLGVYPVAGNLAVLDAGIHVLEVNRFDVAHRLRNLRHGFLRGIFEAFVGLCEDFNHLEHGHLDLSFWFGLRSGTAVTLAIRPGVNGVPRHQPGSHDEMLHDRGRYTGVACCDLEREEGAAPLDLRAVLPCSSSEESASSSAASMCCEAASCVAFMHSFIHS